jgi:glycosyltransferase involved in cell wall biosynthesis
MNFAVKRSSTGRLLIHVYLILLFIARLFITTSLCEGFGYTPVEAALSGTEVISTMCGSLPEVTMNLVNYYYPATDYKELVKKIIELLQKEPDNIRLDTIKYEFEKNIV